MKRTPLKRRGKKPIRRGGGAVQNPEYLDFIRRWGYHHRTGPDSQHVLGKRFWEVHGINRADLWDLYQGIYQGTGAGSTKA
jgi:hypothetical protein